MPIISSIPNNVPEEELYKIVKEGLERKFSRVGNCYFEITAKGVFTSQVNKILDDYALFLFKEKFSPDITGFLKKKETYGISQKIIVAEVKRKITIASIYQAKRYAEILNADYCLLVSHREISERKRRFIIRKKPAITSYFPNREVIIAKIISTGELLVDKEMHLMLPEPFKD
jgi:hypothetical protein